MCLVYMDVAAVFGTHPGVVIKCVYTWDLFSFSYNWVDNIESWRQPRLISLSCLLRISDTITTSQSAVISTRWCHNSSTWNSEIIHVTVSVKSKPLLYCNQIDMGCLYVSPMISVLSSSGWFDNKGRRHLPTSNLVLCLAKMSPTPAQDNVDGLSLVSTGIRMNSNSVWYCEKSLRRENSVLRLTIMT